MSTIFTKSANRTPKETKPKLIKIFMLLTKDLRHSSLQVKKIKGAKQKNIYECRVDKSWRLILKMYDNYLDLLYVGRHDEAIICGGKLNNIISYKVSCKADPQKTENTLERLRYYLSGNSSVLEHKTTTFNNLKKLLTSDDI
jgi:mRNA-degrading endonuclease YafQ of YafQ-DinJ toxin-antitoxin module